MRYDRLICSSNYCRFTFLGPLACARVIVYSGGEYILNPTVEEQENSELDLVVAGTRDGVLMVESEASELPEKIMLGAVQFGFKEFQPVIEKIIELAERSAKDSWTIDSSEAPDFLSKLQDISVKELAPLYKIKEKKKRNESLNEARKKIADTFSQDDSDSGVINSYIKEEEKKNC